MFLADYLKAMFSPTAIFKKRHLLNLFQGALIVVLWCLLLALPGYVRYTPDAVDSQTEEDFSAVADLLPEETASILHSYQNDDGVFDLHQEGQELQEGDLTVLFFPNEDTLSEQLEASSYVLVFTSDSCYLKANQTDYYFSYPSDFSFSSNQELMGQLLEGEITTHNQKARGFNVLYRFFIYLFSDFILVGLAASWISGHRRDYFWSFLGFTECFSMVVLGIGLPSLIASVVSWWVPTPLIILLVQGIGLLVMLYLSYLKTGFKEIK